MQLSPIMERFVLHWGEMGTRWGVNRSVSQIHALLYLSPNPMSAEEIVDILSIARSNVSTSLKELQSWGLVRVTHVLGDRRDHFETDKEMWVLFAKIVEERKRREIDPTLTVLRQCVLDSETDNATPQEIKDRIRNTLVFMEDMSDWYERVKKLPYPTLSALMKMGDRVARFLNRKVER